MFHNHSCHRLFFRLARQNESSLVRLNKRVLTQPGGKISMALRVGPKKALLGVARRLFSSLNYVPRALISAFLGTNRNDNETSTDPSYCISSFKIWINSSAGFDSGWYWLYKTPKLTSIFGEKGMIVVLSRV